LVVLFASEQSVFVAIVAGFVFVAKGTLFYNNCGAFANRANYFSGGAAVDIIILG